jgi:hypothetical protein
MNQPSYEVMEMCTYFCEIKHHDTYPKSFQLQNDPNFIATLQSKF